MPPINWILIGFSLWFILSSLYRYYKSTKIPAEPALEVGRLNEIAPRWLMSLSVAMVAASVLLGSRLFLTGTLLTSVYVLSISLLFNALLEGVTAWMSPPNSTPRIRDWISPLVGLLIGTLFLAAVLFLRSSPVNPSQGVSLAYPVSGSWTMVTGGRTAITNYHHGRPDSQNYAVDMILAEGESEGEIVYSPIDGTVLQAIADRTVGSPEAEGNLVIIEATGGIQIWLAHLRQNSVLVAEGQPVTAGEPIAKVGSTGSADVAHLHIHAQKGESAVPMFFGKGKRFLLRNDSVSVE